VHRIATVGCRSDHAQREVVALRSDALRDCFVQVVPAARSVAQPFPFARRVSLDGGDECGMK